MIIFHSPAREFYQCLIALPLLQAGVIIYECEAHLCSQISLLLIACA
jgi:hypothetical protein